MKTIPWLELLDFTPKNYNGVEVTPKQFNLFREMNIFKSLVFDQMMEEDYQVWVSKENLEVFVAKGLITEDDVAMDFAFVAQYLNRFDYDVKVIGANIGKLAKIYQPIVAPTKNFEYFDKLVASNIGLICDVYA